MNLNLGSELAPTYLSFSYLNSYRENLKRKIFLVRIYKDNSVSLLTNLDTPGQHITLLFCILSEPSHN